MAQWVMQMTFHVKRSLLKPSFLAEICNSQVNLDHVFI